MIEINANCTSFKGQEVLVAVDEKGKLENKCQHLRDDGHCQRMVDSLTVSAVHLPTNCTGAEIIVPGVKKES